MDASVATGIVPVRAKCMRAVMHRLVLSWHRWTGLTIGLVLVFMAATGILISYRSRLEPAVYRGLLCVRHARAPRRARQRRAGSAPQR